MEAPVLIQAIPDLVVNELAAYGPLDLKEYISVPEGSTPPTFSAETNTGESLPTGMILTTDGSLTGIPAKGTSNRYDIVVTAENEAGAIQVEFALTIQEAPYSRDAAYIDQLKAQVWQAVEDNLPIPNLDELYSQEITALEIYYLLERWGVFKIWDAFNLDPPSELNLLQLEGVSEHYNVYDRGSCLVACPKDLFSHERTLEDGLRTARAMANEVYKRGWTVELSGFDKLTRAAWIQIQHLGDQHGKRLDVINFEPSPEDVRVYSTQAAAMGYRSMEG